MMEMKWLAIWQYGCQQGNSSDVGGGRDGGAGGETGWNIYRKTRLSYSRHV